MKFVNEPTAVEVHFDTGGAVRPRRFTWEKTWHDVSDVGRQWVDASPVCPRENVRRKTRTLQDPTTPHVLLTLSSISCALCIPASVNTNDFSPRRCLMRPWRSNSSNTSNT
jgi:hypothetical protein